MSENLKDDILKVVQSQQKNTDCNNAKATELRQPQKSEYSTQTTNLRAAQILIENAGNDSDSQ